MEKPLKMCQRLKEGWGIRIFRTQQKSLLLRDVKDNSRYCFKTWTRGGYEGAPELSFCNSVLTANPIFPNV